MKSIQKLYRKLEKKESSRRCRFFVLPVDFPLESKEIMITTRYQRRSFAERKATNSVPRVLHPGYGRLSLRERASLIARHRVSRVGTKRGEMRDLIYRNAAGLAKPDKRDACPYGSGPRIVGTSVSLVRWCDPLRPGASDLSQCCRTGEAGQARRLSVQPEVRTIESLFGPASRRHPGPRLHRRSP